MIAAYDSSSDSFPRQIVLVFWLLTFSPLEIIALAYQQEPNRILWALLAEGRLLGPDV